MRNVKENFIMYFKDRMFKFVVCLGGGGLVGWVFLINFVLFSQFPSGFL